MHSILIAPGDPESGPPPRKCKFNMYWLQNQNVPIITPNFCIKINTNAMEMPKFLRTIIKSWKLLKMYNLPAPRIEGPPGCEDLMCLYPLSYVINAPVSSILCILVFLHLHPFIPVSCVLHVVSCILDSANCMLYA